MSGVPQTGRTANAFLSRTFVLGVCVVASVVGWSLWPRITSEHGILRLARPLDDSAPPLARYMQFTVHPEARPAAARPRPSLVPTHYNTRGCVCKVNWQVIVAMYPPPLAMPLCQRLWTPEEVNASAEIPGESVCTCGGVECPPGVTPAYLTAAATQEECSLRRHTGYLCTVRCNPQERLLEVRMCGGGGRGTVVLLVWYSRRRTQSRVLPSPTPRKTRTAAACAVVSGVLCEGRWQ